MVRGRGERGRDCVENFRPRGKRGEIRESVPGTVAPADFHIDNSLSFFRSEEEGLDPMMIGGDTRSPETEKGSSTPCKVNLSDRESGKTGLLIDALTQSALEGKVNCGVVPARKSRASLCMIYLPTCCVQMSAHNKAIPNSATFHSRNF